MAEIAGLGVIDQRGLGLLEALGLASTGLAHGDFGGVLAVGAAGVTADAGGFAACAFGFLTDQLVAIHAVLLLVMRPIDNWQGKAPQP